jgi:hypothetical protein
MGQRGRTFTDDGVDTVVDSGAFGGCAGSK